MEHLGAFFPVVTEEIVEQSRGRVAWGSGPGDGGAVLHRLTSLSLQLSNKAPSYLLDIYDG